MTELFRLLLGGAEFNFMLKEGRFLDSVIERTLIEEISQIICQVVTTAIVIVDEEDLFSLVLDHDV